MVAKEVSVNFKTKNTLKSHYFPSFLLCLKNNLHAIETPKKLKNS